jgi:hypothetical protein
MENCNCYFFKFLIPITDYHREEHCLACGSCFRGARAMQFHVAENHPPEKIFRDVFIHGYDSPETFYQCSNCPRSFYSILEAEHHFFTVHIAMGDCSRELGRRPPETWWPWAQLYPQMDIYSDYRCFVQEIRNIRHTLRRQVRIFISCPFLPKSFRQLIFSLMNG